jgi:hypothetical protein
LIAVWSCEARSVERRWLALVQVRPQNHVGVFLNEKLQLDFSEALDPTSVDRQSVRVTADDGVPARGELRVDEDRLVFVPDPVLAFDLSDGGYRPGRTYYVDLAGFPLVNGLRGRSGAPLARNLRLEFRTVEVTEPRSGFVFEDSSQSRGLRVVLRSTSIEPGDPIVLEGEEPLDPSTLFGADFVLQRELIEQQQPGRTRPPLSAPIALRAQLTQNHDRNEPLARGTALIELLPVDRLLEPGRYWLNVDADKLRLRDFGGNRVKIWARDPTINTRLEVTVAPRTPGAENASWFQESFVDARQRSFEWPDGFDGTARWSGNGRVEIVWPAAALDGRDGDVRLPAREPRRDVHATRLVLAAGSACELDSTPGLVVLRAQGKLTIAGELRRTTHGGAATNTSDGDPRAPFMALMKEERSLSEALADAAAADMDATVLIAGGDLVIDGRVDCDQPVLLVAGGRIRAARGDVVGANGLYYLGDGGSVLQDRHASPQRALAAVQSRLALDPPSKESPNPLAVPMSWAVVSSSIPPVGGASRWHVGPTVVAYDGIGRARVRYLGERVELDGVREILVDDPGALSDCPTLRLQVELYLPGRDEKTGAGRDEKVRPWDPPWVDDVRLEFDRATAREAR